MDKHFELQRSSKNNYEHTVVGNQTLSKMNLDKEIDAQTNKHSTTCNTLDLSKKQLQCIGEALYTNTPCIRNMHLEGNALCSIPQDFFLQLPYLVWLDLRYNKITSLPSTIGDHRQLQYLLLEGNPLKALPVELGDLSTLKALNLRHCPLEFPPDDVVHKGLDSILTFLRNSRKKDAACCEFSEDVNDESRDSGIPPIEKLQLKDLLGSSFELSEEWGNEEEKKRFEILRKRIEQEERKEMLQGQACGLRVALQEASSHKIKAAKWNFLTGSRHTVPLGGRSPEVDRRAQNKERLALIIEKNKAQETLKEWQKQTKMMQEGKTKRKTKEVKVTSIAPYATALDDSPKNDDCNKKNPSIAEKLERLPRIMSMKSLEEMEKAGASRDLRLEHRIRQHIQAMQERKKNLKGTAQEELEVSKKEIETAALLQAELLQRKREQELLEYRFTAFTGETYSSPPSQGRPQNIFATAL